MMFYQLTFAWLYWDPPAVAFTIPYFDHPIVWYGILFVFGFILGYFIINPIFVRFLKDNPHLSDIDVLDWDMLIETLIHYDYTLNSSDHPLAEKLLKKIKQKFPSLESALSVKKGKRDGLADSHTQEFRAVFLEACNELLENGLCTREELQSLFGSDLATYKQTAYFLTDRLCWFTVAGTVIGARLGAVLFYDWPLYAKNPIEIFKVWHGGLASHGGVLGVVLALYLYLRYVQRWIPRMTLLKLLDIVSIPSALAGCFIRLGNFMNQEILGTPTALPWGIIFGHPADGSVPEPRHPVQLYEATAYFLIFILLWNLWRKQSPKFSQPGQTTGLLFLLLFGSRFIIEFFKATQASLIDSPWIQMGQLLSIPFIIFGIALIFRKQLTLIVKKTTIL